MATENRSGDGQAPVFPGDALELARFDQPTGDGTTFVVVSDPHLTPTDHGTLKMYHRTKQRFQMAVADAHRLDVDGFIVAGDLTKAGRESEIALAEELLRIAPRPTVVVPGNHDIAPRGFPNGDVFADWRGDDAYPQSRSVDSVTVHTVDTTVRPDATGGAVDPQTLCELGAQTSSGPQIAVMHHPLSAIPTPFRSELADVDYRVENPAATADSLVESGVDLAVTGHLHWPYATDFRGLNVVCAPSCASFPPAYLLVHVGPNGTTVSLVPLAGASGLKEAYQYAIQDEQRGSLIETAVSNGYFGAFPLVDQQAVGRTEAPTRQSADLSG